MLYSRISFPLIIFCGFTSLGFAQKSKSYSTTIGKNTADTARVRSYLAQAKMYEDSEPDSASYYYEKAKTLAISANDNLGLNDYFLNYILFLNHKGQFEEAMSISRQHVALGRKSGDSSMVMHAYNEVANDEEYLSDFQPSTVYYLKALQLAQRLDNKECSG